MFSDKIVILGIALSLDAFGVALGIGCGKKLMPGERVSLVISFAFFQYLFAFLGGILGNFIDSNFFNISGLASGVIILILGIILLREGSASEEECIYYQLNFWKYLLLGISVSIDALGVGFSVLYHYPLITLLGNSLLVGLITLLFTTAALLVARYIRNFKVIESYSDYIGGVILIILGLRMIF